MVVCPFSRAVVQARSCWARRAWRERRTWPAALTKSFLWCGENVVASAGLMSGKETRRARHAADAGESWEAKG